MKLTKSLKASGSELANAGRQIDLLEKNTNVPKFEEKLAELGLSPLKPTQIEIFQVNVGKMCNQTCKHCHVDAGPDRKEIMTRETMALCIEALRQSPSIKTVDLTGGAPEMNPDFRWFVEEIRKLDRHVIVRCNLTIIVANKKYYDLPEFFKKHKIEVVSSLPYYNKRRTDSQRGDGVFESSMRALKMLNEVGYGREEGLLLNLVYNPTGAFLPGPQGTLEADFKKALKRDFDLDFNSLFAITNLPISRFLDYLIASGNYDGYMEKLVNAFNPEAAKNVMCRNTISIGWDGYLFDCDFNQMLDLKFEKPGLPQHLRDWNEDQLNGRDIILNQHCYGCTAGAGSSCGGEVA